MKIVPMTHEQYLDQPGEFIQWMIRIDDLVDQVTAEKEKEAGES